MRQRTNTAKLNWLVYNHTTIVQTQVDFVDFHCRVENQLVNIDEPHIIWYDLIFFPTSVSRLTIL